MDKPYAVSADRLRIMFHGLMAVKLPSGLAFADYDHIAAILNVAYAAGRTSAESAWHPVSEPPDKCRAVVTYSPHREMVTGKVVRGDWVDHYGDLLSLKITHWHELPGPPE